jgi:amidophosphoribosyltransferase
MCGILALYSNELKSNQVSIDLYNMFQSLQHRGQDGTGMVSSDIKQFYTTHSLGPIKNLADKVINLKGHLALAHNRYPTAGKAGQLHLLQPWRIYNRVNKQIYYLAFNGNLSKPGTDELETFNQIIGGECSPGKGLKKLINKIPGAYSLILITKDSLYICRDIYGIRPLIIAKEKNNWIVSSETCVLSNPKKYEKFIEVNPGEIIRINYSGLEYVYKHKKIKPAFCIFEYIYFSRPDTILESNNEVYQIRINLGKQLAKEYLNKNGNKNIDYIIGVPNSSVPHAIGFSQESGIPYCPGLIRNTTHRTFILSNQKSRKEQISRKFSCLPLILENKSVIVIDDSIVRGNTIINYYY